MEEATSLSVWTIACLCGTLRLENVCFMLWYQQPELFFFLYANVIFPYANVNIMLELLSIWVMLSYFYGRLAALF